MLLCGQATAAQQYNHGDPTDAEQVMLELVNRARLDPAAEAKRFGISLNAGLPPGTIPASPQQPLALNPILIKAARLHSDWMLEEEVFSHTGAGGSDAGQRMRDAGFRFEGSWKWAENIAAGGVASSGFVASTVQRHEDLFRSASHRVNLCDADVGLIGIGVLRGIFQTFDTAMVTQNFAASDAYPEALLVGVVYRDKNKNGAYDAGEGMKGVRVKPRGNDWFAITSTSGGYAVPGGQEASDIVVEFSGGGMADTVLRKAKQQLTNAKVDVVIKPAPLLQLVKGTKLLKDGSKVKFPAAKIGARPIRKFTLRNRGDAKLTGIKLAKSGKNQADFVIIDRVPRKLAPGASTTFQVAFRPKTKGKKEAVLRFKSNDKSQSPFLIRVTGQGR